MWEIEVCLEDTISEWVNAAEEEDGERHLRRVLREYVGYYHESRAHVVLDKDTPDGREVEPPELGPVLRRPMVGRLHSRY